MLGARPEQARIDASWRRSLARNGKRQARLTLAAALTAGNRAVLEWPRRTRTGLWQSLALDPDGNRLVLTV
jgi:hypothetical protein